MRNQAMDATSAYNLPETVRSYDRDMELMHPNRAAMCDAALNFLMMPAGAPLRALDLGTGTGFLAARLLSRFENARLVCVDGADRMLEIARTRLGAAADRAEFIAGDFRNLGRIMHTHRPERFDAVFSAFALHHLETGDKRDVISQAAALLAPGGWFFNADIIISPHPGIEDRIQRLRENGIVARANGADARFADATATRRYLDELEKRDGDQPQLLEVDLQTVRNAGLQEAAVIWLEYREAVICGQKPGSESP